MFERRRPWNVRGATLRPGRGVLMGVLNVTPDSFSDGGAFETADAAMAHAETLIAGGAAIVDIGGESTRPGAPPVPEEVELRRVLPVVERLVNRGGCLISIDTSKAAVAQAALAAGAHIVNDVTGLRGDPRMGEVAAAARAGVVLMHMKGTPRTMQIDPNYERVVGEVREHLERRRNVALMAGIAPEALVYDPGIGFGKTPAHNLELLRNLSAFAIDNQPVLIGFSRKSFIARLVGSTAMTERLWPSVALTALCRELGADLFRVHDVAECHDALRVAEAVANA